MAYFEESKANSSNEIKNMSHSYGMVPKELELIEKRSGIILREVGDLRLSNRSFEASVGLSHSFTWTLQASVVGVYSRFGEMFEREMTRTRDSL